MPPPSPLNFESGYGPDIYTSNGALLHLSFPQSFPGVFRGGEEQARELNLLEDRAPSFLTLSLSPFLSLEVSAKERATALLLPRHISCRRHRKLSGIACFKLYPSVGNMHHHQRLDYVVPCSHYISQKSRTTCQNKKLSGLPYRVNMALNGTNAY